MKTLTRQARLIWAGFFFLLFGSGALLWADSQDALMERFRERAPVIDELRASGLVGENNRGLLTPRGNLSQQQGRIVEAENRDRQAFYALIAERRNLPPEQVGRVRARSIAERSSPGVWLQSPEGEWYQKE